jgi:hypothetical protein
MERVARFFHENWLTLAVVAALAIGYFALRSQGADVASASEVTDRLGQGKPVVLYFFSNT